MVREVLCGGCIFGGSANYELCFFRLMMNKTESKHKSYNNIPLSTLIICAILLIVFVIILVGLLIYLRLLKMRKKEKTIIKTLIPIIFVSNNGLCLRKVEGNINFVDNIRRNSKDYTDPGFEFIICDIGNAHYSVFDDDHIIEYKEYSKNYFRTL